MPLLRLESLPDTLPSGSPLTPSEPLLTAVDVSLLLGIQRASVHAYARQTEVKIRCQPCRSAGTRRFYRGELDRWLARQRG